VSSSMVLPLTEPDGTIIGVLNFSRHANSRPFAEADLERAIAVASHVALAASNAKLMERLKGEIKEAERLRRLAEIGQMTATIAHEIRNPLTGIRSAAQMVREDISEADEFLGVIEEEVLKLNELCEQFLEFAKPLQLNLEPTDLSELVETVINLQRQDFLSEGVELTVETGSNEPKINLDNRRIEQVVHNLLRNARQACRKGGRVRVSVKGLELKIEDDGVGMTEEQREKLFTPFFTTKSNGTGLGLSNVRRILDAHKASVVVETEFGEGSRFTVEFERNSI